MLNLNKLNQEQREAVCWNSGPLLVIAGPGSGKTTVIINHIQYLLSQKISSNKILVVTFSKEAAKSMQERFLHEEDNHEVTFGTFHSLFYKILLKSGNFQDYKIANEKQKKTLVQKVLRPLLGREYPDSLDDDILLAISYYKNTLDMEGAKEKIHSEAKDKFLTAFWQYQTLLHDSKLIDFDDMLYETYRAILINENLLQYWKTKYEYILIDEFQDCNHIQYEILRKLIDMPYHIFAVGDDDQSIYGFRGAAPSILKQFVTDYHADMIRLKVNYRSTSKIISFSSEMIKDNKDRIEKFQNAFQNGDAEEVHINCVESRDAQAKMVEKLICELHTNSDKCAVLFRTNIEMLRIAHYLKRVNIPFIVDENSGNIYNHFILKDLEACCSILSGIWSKETMLRIVMIKNQILTRESIFQAEKIKDVTEWYRRRAPDWSAKKEAISFLTELEKQSVILSGSSLKLSLLYIAKRFGYIEYLRRKCNNDMELYHEWLDLYEWFLEEMKNFSNLKEWYSFREMKYKKKECSLYLMTIHKSKGLEFDTVIIPDCNETIIPQKNAKTQTQIEEERRIFYVALTRAKKNLELLYINNNSVRSRPPSRFLNFALIQHQ